MDISETLAPKSDQINADDLMTGPATVTVKEVTKGTAEQPVNVELVEYPGRPYKPSKSMRRILAAAWGAEASAWAGRRITIFRNPEIRFGGSTVGGIEISALSHLEKPLTVALTATRGKRKAFTVQPLKEAPKPAQGAGEIPDNVIKQLEKAIEDDNVNAYVLWLKEQGAPQHIVEYVVSKAPTPEAVS